MFVGVLLFERAVKARTGQDLRARKLVVSSLSCNSASSGDAETSAGESGDHKEEKTHSPFSDCVQPIVCNVPVAREGVAKPAC